MRLLNFKVSDDHVGIESEEGKYFDLHNNFNLISFKYQFEGRYFQLNLERSKGDWVNEDDPPKLIFKCLNVQFLRVKELDQEPENLVEFPEDDKTISMIGFSDKENKDYLGVLLNIDSIEELAFTIQTQNGQVLIIACETIELDIIED